LSSPDPLTSYNIAGAWSGSDLDFFASSRVGTFQELLPAGDGLTLRGGAIVKHVLMLLAEHRLPFSYFDRVLSSESFRATLLSRTVARTLQALFRSDIRQAVFARQRNAPYLWVCDEAQNFFRTRQLRENMVELLTQSRSFGSFFLYLTQNLTTAVQESEMLET